MSFSFYSSLFSFPSVSLQFRVCSSRQLRVHLVITPMIVPSSFAKIVAMPGVVFPLLLQHRSTSTFSAIELRINSLQSSSLSTAYSKQKQSLRADLALPGQKNLFDATPLDICRFLVFKDSKGKTQVHKAGCLHLGQRGIFSCQCPLRLAYSTVDSYIGKLRSIFSDIGRQGDWNRTLFLGNPASDLQRSNFGLVSPPSKLFLFFLTSCFCFPDTLKSVFSFRPFLRLRYSSLLEIKLSSRLYSSPVIEVGIWGKSRHLSLLVSRTTMDSCLIMFGARPCGMVRLTFLECIDTLIQPSALSELLKAMGRLRENFVLAYPVDICFVPLILRAILLIPPFKLHS